MTTFAPNLGILELHVSYRCNLRCNNCSNLCTQAPATMDLSVEDVKDMLRQSYECGRKWGMITIHGGEPSYHPRIIEICQAIVDYKAAHNPDVTLWYLTNESNVFVNGIVRQVADMGIPIGRAPKSGKNQNPNGSWIPYVPVNESPVDLEEEYNLGCFQTATCGIAYNAYGFYECSPAASAARVFGYDPLAVRVEDVNEASMSCGYAEHCRHCGFAMPERRRVTEQETTKTWTEAFDRYTKQGPMAPKSGRVACQP